jgi:hypothetical protein
MRNDCKKTAILLAGRLAARQGGILNDASLLNEISKILKGTSKN